MVVGLCQIALRVRGARSLKDKRSVVRSVVDRIGARFPITVSEVGQQDDLRQALVGFAAVGNDSRRLEETIDRVLGFIEQHSVAEILTVDREVFTWNEAAEYATLADVWPGD